MLAGDKRSSLLRKSVNYSHKKFFLHCPQKAPVGVGKMGKPAEPAKPVKPVNLLKPAARPPKPESNEPVKTDESIDDKTLEKVLENILVSIL